MNKKNILFLQTCSKINFVSREFRNACFNTLIWQSLLSKILLYGNDKFVQTYKTCTAYFWYFLKIKFPFNKTKTQVARCFAKLLGEI